MPTTEQVRRHTFEETLRSARDTMQFSEILKLAVDGFKASKMRFAPHRRLAWSSAPLPSSS